MDDGTSRTQFIQVLIKSIVLFTSFSPKTLDKCYVLVKENQIQWFSKTVTVVNWHNKIENFSNKDPLKNFKAQLT